MLADSLGPHEIAGGHSTGWALWNLQTKEEKMSYSLINEEIVSTWKKGINYLSEHKHEKGFILAIFFFWCQQASSHLWAILWAHGRSLLCHCVPFPHFLNTTHPPHRPRMSLKEGLHKQPHFLALLWINLLEPRPQYFVPEEYCNNIEMKVWHLNLSFLAVWIQK